jgi:alpha-N-arabinofuranosidase
MREAGRFMDGLSVHYYTVPGPWGKKGSATDFTTGEWQVTIQKAANIEGFIRRTSGIMDRYDPQKRVGIAMDEWGTWFDPEPGTNPGFLPQQNTIRDAVVAGLSLNVFHNHADRVKVRSHAKILSCAARMRDITNAVIMFGLNNPAITERIVIVVDPTVIDHEGRVVDWSRVPR